MSLFPELHAVISEITLEQKDMIEVISAGFGNVDAGLDMVAPLTERQVAVIYKTFTSDKSKCVVLSIDQYRAAMKS